MSLSKCFWWGKESVMKPFASWIKGRIFTELREGEPLVSVYVRKSAKPSKRMWKSLAFYLVWGNFWRWGQCKLAPLINARDFIKDFPRSHRKNTRFGIFTQGNEETSRSRPHVLPMYTHARICMYVRGKKKKKTARVCIFLFCCRGVYASLCAKIEHIHTIWERERTKISTLMV